MSRSIGLDQTLTAYVRAANRPEHPALARCRAETAARADRNMQISPEQGAFMALMARLTGAKLAVEVGVYTGYSALATMLAMRDMHGDAARLIACDVSTEFINAAESYWAEAGVAGQIEPVIGNAVDSLRRLAEDGCSETVDMMFVDADKTGYGDYYAAALTLLRPGGVVLFDNVLWNGDVADPSKTDADTVALRAIAEKARDDARVETAFTAIGDGLLIVMKR
ncbi:MAG: class I SAM-dependent methyltransferase [Maricaulaceae bacterium]|nr:class I SAM-dependent methyltransferase [Maricaulaceae bacterium]